MVKSHTTTDDYFMMKKIYIIRCVCHPPVKYYSYSSFHHRDLKIPLFTTRTGPLFIIIFRSEMCISLILYCTAGGDKKPKAWSLFVSGVRGGCEAAHIGLLAICLLLREARRASWK